MIRAMSHVLIWTGLYLRSKIIHNQNFKNFKNIFKAPGKDRAPIQHVKSVHVDGRHERTTVQAVASVY